ncbi:MAG: hypothetical protein JO327_02865 [Nitrososphaeraceae archaeon]|nr:hypothetical protein [Nitrososphaeraceae archaeon]MBV9667052.1 hypothetical protein [Nitrososphaeraceae archaeon]
MSDEEKKLSISRHNILSLVDSFIDQIFQIRKTLRGVSISAIILAPLAIALSIYLLLNPSFFAVLEVEDEFGFILSILLGAVIIISSIWIITGIRQYRLVDSWNKRYNEYINNKEEIDRKIISRYGLDNNNKS